MNIAPLSLNTNNSATAPNFGGKVFAKGDNWPYALRVVFEKSKPINEVAQNIDKHICGRLSTSKYKQSSLFHHKGAERYRINLYLEKDGANKFERMWNYMLAPFKNRLTKRYHSEYSTMEIIDEKMNAKYVRNKLSV